MSGKRQQKQEEISVVSSPYAVVHPWTVVVKILHAVVTHGTMRASWRSIKAAGRTPFHANLDSFDLYCLVEGCAEIILFILIFFRSGENAWVHKSGHAEVGKSEKKHYGDIDGDN